MISLLNHDSSEGDQWGRDQIYPDIMIKLSMSSFFTGQQPSQIISGEKAHRFPNSQEMATLGFWVVNYPLVNIQKAIEHCHL